MENLEKYFNKLSAVVTVVGGFLTYQFQSMPDIVKGLVILATIDYILGLFIAGMNKNIKSDLARMGAIKKVYNVIIIGLAFIFDNLLGQNGWIYSAVLWFYISYEGLSILEHGNSLGIKYPKFLNDLLKSIHNHNDNMQLPDDWQPDQTTVIKSNDPDIIKMFVRGEE